MCSISLLEERQRVFTGSFSECLVDYIKNSDDLMGGIRRGLAALREGKVKPWSEIKKELDIG